MGTGTDVSGYVSPQSGVYDTGFYDWNDAVEVTAEDTLGYLGGQGWPVSESEEVLVVYFWESSDGLSILEQM